MSDLNKEALDIWGGLKPMIDQEISSRTQGMVQRRKAKVTTAPSLATNTIGVTEAFGDEMFLPFVSNIISAKVGDFVWIEWMYGATNAFVSSYAAVDDKNVSVAGVLDVVPRRCYADLSSAGWYRAIRFDAINAFDVVGADGSILDINISRIYNYVNNDAHKISLLRTYNNCKFTNESSLSNTLGIDKIRLTVHDGGSGDRHAYIDIHYALSSVNPVAVHFNVSSAKFSVENDYTDKWFAESLQSVADSPAGETLIAEYTFAENGTGDVTVNGVLDVVPRRCEAQLPTSGNSAGWYRVLTLTGNSVDRPLGSPSFVIDITIVRQFGSSNNELHKVSLLACYNSIAFANETSKSNTVVVDKIRYVRNGMYGYIDIHYDTSALNYVAVRFDVKAFHDNQNFFVATTPTAVADSPAGETEVTRYEFTANGIRTVTLTSAHSSVTINGQKVARSGNVVSLWVDFTVSASISGYGYLINTPTFATAANALVYNSYITVQNVRLYADEGNSGLRCYGEFPSGRYVAFITYITTDV